MYDYGFEEGLALTNKTFASRLNKRISELEFLNIYSSLGEKFMIYYKDIEELLYMCENLYKNIKCYDFKRYKYAEESFYSCKIEGARISLPQTQLITTKKKVSKIKVKNGL